jgi:hypothetical protein
MTKFNSGDYVESKIYKGISMVVIGNTKEMIEIECTHHFENDEEYEFCFDCESYYEEPDYQVLDDTYDCIMVGDDRVFKIDVSDLEIINSDEFCIECGQIGCSVSTLNN